MEKAITKIVIPVDFTAHTKKLVEYALTVAKALEAEVTFAHVVESFSGYDMLLVHPSFKQMSEDLRAKAEERMAALIEDNKAKVAKVSGDIIVGDVVEELLEYAKDKDFDLMIVGTHGTKGLEKVLMGSVAERLSKKSPCPILIVNPIQYLLHKWHKIEGNI